MKYISELIEILGQQLDWHKSRLDCFGQMLLALFMVRSVNLSEIALAMPGEVLIESRYKRIKRFFLDFHLILTPFLVGFIYYFFLNRSQFILL
ncbi:TPA: hypothetical protein ACTXXA_003738 [Legionella anisa]